MYRRVSATTPSVNLRARAAGCAELLPYQSRGAYLTRNEAE
jgi:hypothetical protein